jgi:fatty acid desaturase
MCAQWPGDAMDESQESLGSLKKIVADCFEIRRWIYWVDLVGTAAVAWGAFFATELLWPLSPPAAAATFVVSTFAFYRGILFIHELTHRDRDEVRGFSLAWNLLFGTPWLLPSFLFRGVHLEHHRQTSYGTGRDFEYLPFGATPLVTVLSFTSQSFVMPAVMVLRFGLLAPLSLLAPRLRQYVMVHASALTMRFGLPRKIPTGRDLRNWYVQEFLCCAWVLCVAALLATGTMPASVLVHSVALMIAVFLVNSVRTPISHRYSNVSERELSFHEQVLDSVSIDTGILAELLCPVGFRYHGLHHLLPAIPYHQLGIAHRRLRAQLPASSFYHSTVEPSVATALASLWTSTSRRVSRPSPDGA